MSKKKRGSLGIDNAVRANIDMRPRFTPNPDMAQYNPRMDADGNIVADIPAGVSYQDLMDEYLRTQNSPTVNNIQTHTTIYPEEPQVSVSAAAASPVVTIAQVPQQQSWLPYMFMSSLLGKSNKKESLEDRLNTVADVINGRKPLEALQPSSQVKRRGPRLLTEGLADKAVQYALMKNWLPQQQSVVTVEQPGLQQSMPADAVRQVAPPIQTYPPMPVVPNIQPPVTSRVVVPASAYTEQVPTMDEVYVAEPASSSSKSNTSNEARLWDRGQHHYKEMSAWGTGLSDIALAGILGNVGLESGFIPTATNGSHHGYLQNDNSIRDFIVKHYGGYGHKQQMQYLHDGLTGRLRGGSTGQGKALQRRFNRYINAVKNVTDPVKAARLWEQYYEISGGQAMRDRERNAQYFYDQISSSGPGAFRRVQATVPRRYDEGGDLTDDGITDTPIRNYQWRTMPETDVTYNDYNTGLPVQAGDKVWTDENGNIVTTNSNPNVAADYAVQYGNPTFELDYPEITIEGNGKGYFTGESFADRYARELAAPIAKNVDVDPVFKEQAQALVDFEIEKERQHRANEEFNRQVDNFFGANWLRPSQLVGAFNPGGVDDGVTFGERFLLGTNNYGLWNPNSKFLREHPYLAEGANILFDLAAPQAIINGVPEMTRAAANAARKGAINTAARASFYFPQKDAAAKASQLWRNQEYNNFLNTVNGDNYYELVQSTANRPKVYYPNEEYFISHTTPWAEFTETGFIPSWAKTEAEIAEVSIDPAYFVNAKNKLYEFPHETFGDLQSTGAALGKMKKVYDTPVRDLGESHLKYGNLSSGPRGEVSTMGNFPNTYRQGWGLTERPLLKTLAYPEGIYDYNPIYENIFRGPQTIVTGDELADALLHSNYNIYERTPNGVQRTLFLGEPQIQNTAAGGSEHSLGIGFEDMDFSSSLGEKNIFDRYIYGNLISGEDVFPGRHQQLQLGLDPEVAEYLMKNKVGRDVQALIDEGLTNPEIAAARGEGKRELLENVRVGEYGGDEYNKAGMEHSGGFFNEDKNFISVNRDSGFPKGFVQKHEGTHLLDKYTTLTDAQETALSSAYGKDFEALSDWDQADDWLKGYKHMQKERVTTNRDARDVLLGDYQKFDIHQQNLIIDRMSDEKIVDAVRKANGYGRNYIAYLEQTGGLTPKKINQFREAMKKVGVVTGVAAVGASAVTN